MFSSPDIFSEGVYRKINAHLLSSEDFQPFFRNVLSSGHITDVFMAPRWETSQGASDEHETAKRLRLTIHYL
jgi:hypothetical protein